VANDMDSNAIPTATAETYFYDLADRVIGRLHANEVLLINYVAEQSDFVRLNHNQIRQAGNVAQHELQLVLIAEQRQSSAWFNMCGDLPSDLAQADALLSQLRTQLAHLPPDPYLHVATDVQHSAHHGENHLPSPQDTLQQIMTSANDLDLVGIWASGVMLHGFANSYGQRNWHSKHNFNFDWSLYYKNDKAVKQAYAGDIWNDTAFQHKLEHGRQNLGLLAKPAKTIAPGRYRVFLTPVALQELLALLGWGGFGLKSHRTQQTPLLKMVKDGMQLSPKVTLTEQHAAGLAPGFTPEGFSKPASVVLIENGQYRDCLANARSAKEYGTEVNCGSESPQSLQLNGGGLKQNDILPALDTGVYISNLWYGNYSDRNHCRMTGMTRFACLWVENGEPRAPLNVMRFDESLYHALGDKLIDLTEAQETLLDPQSYQRRSQRSARLPGALIEAFTFTL
jgi:predicted Zn-dependent protease